MAVLATGAVTVGIIRDGVSGWVPNIIYEIFGVEKYLSVIISFVIPATAVFGAFIGQNLVKKFKNNMGVCAGTLVFTTAVITVVIFCYDKSVALIVALLALSTLATTLLANQLVSVIPLQFRKISNSGRLSGILNFFTYVGSAISSYGLGAIADVYGWKMVMIFLAVAAAAACLIMTAGSFYWKKKIMPLF